ncbi:Leucine Rich repeat [Novymonas esmeraldas]|uniref:Leucine Rich repeat n=1 Tax=Novymonas esmeraldas TaxID=1808958 RepID=A0AAW0F097_9TRYP
MDLYALASVLSYYPAPPSDLTTPPPPPPPCTSCHCCCCRCDAAQHRRGGGRGGGGAGRLGSIPLAFAAAHPASRLAAESSAAGYRAYGVLVWHRPLWRERCSSYGVTSPRTTHTHRRTSEPRAMDGRSGCSSGSRSNSSNGSDPPEEAPGLVQPPLGLRVASEAAFLASWRDDGGRGRQHRGGSAPSPLPPVMPAAAKVIVLLHMCAASDVKGSTTTSTTTAAAAESACPSALWVTLQPMGWWLQACVRPTRSWRCSSRWDDECDEVGDGAARWVEDSAAVSTPSPPQLSCALRLFVSPTAMPRRQRCRWSTAAVSPAPCSREPWMLWCAHAVVEVGLSGLRYDTPQLFSPASYLATLAQRTVGGGGVFAEDGRSRATASGQRHRNSGCVHLYSLDDVWGPAAAGGGHEDATRPPRLLAAVRAPLLPLHTLDLSLRVDLNLLEETLSRWAAAGLLRRLRRLSLLGCRQLHHLRWIASLPADTLEVLDISGCDELRSLREVRWCASLRRLVAAQLPRLEQLGWWDNNDEDEEDEVDEVAVVAATASDAVLHWPTLLEDLDLSCTQRRVRPIDDFACVALLEQLQRLSICVPEETAAAAAAAAPLEAPVRGTLDRVGEVAEAVRRCPYALEWLSGCAELRDLRLSFLCGGGVGVGGRSTSPARRRGPPWSEAVRARAVARRLLESASIPRPAMARLLQRAGLRGGGGGETHHASATVVGADVVAGGHTSLSYLADHPFPRLHSLELHRAVLADGFTSWVASGCSQLRRLRLLSCSVACSEAGIRRAQSLSCVHGAVVITPRAASVGEWDVATRRRDEQWWWGRLARLRHLRCLHVVAAEGLQEGGALDWIAECTALRELTFRQCRWLLDVYAAHRLPQLRVLNLSSTGIDDLTCLRMRDGVIVAGAANVTPPPPLPQHCRTPLPVTALRQLTEVVLIDCPFVRDLRPLSCLTSCRRLYASDHHHVKSLDHLSTCRALEELYLIHYARLSDIASLRWLRALRVLYITHSSVRDVSWVAHRAPGGSGGGGDDACVLPLLEVLTLTDSRLLTDVRALGALPKLQQLHLNDCIALTSLGASVASSPHSAAPLSSLRPRTMSSSTTTTSSSSSNGPHGTVAAMAGQLRRWCGAAAVAAAGLGTWNLRPFSSSSERWTRPRIPCSLAHLNSTLRYLDISGCRSLVDGSAMGDLAALEYLHAPFTGVCDVRWIGGCRSLKVLDIAGSPCCVGAAQSALEAALPRCLPALELLNSRPVDELPWGRQT